MTASSRFIHMWTRALIAGLVAFLVPVALAFAHGQKPGAGQGRIEPVLDPLPRPLATLRVQIHESLAPQLVVENPGDAPLEILDELGAPFLRLGPKGAEANLASVAFYRTSSPSDAVPVPQDVIEAGAAGRVLPPRWQQIAKEPAWGWFDRRIEVDERKAPHNVIEADQLAEVGRFTIPLRLGGVEQALQGKFVYRPRARGALRLRMSSRSEIAPGVRVSLLSGRGGSFFLRSDATEPITLLGRAGEPVLRFTPDGVEANHQSPTYAELSRLRGSATVALVTAGAEPDWQRVSGTPRYGWVDPRTFVDVPVAVRAAGEKAEVARWTLPIRVGAGDAVRLVEIQGATWWEPLRAGAIDR